VVITRLEKIREYLESELARLYQDLNAAETLHHGDSFSNERAELAMQALERNKQIVLQVHLRERITEVERALEKLDKGMYGLCDNCGQPIPYARLETIPQANLCVECKVLQEKKR